MTRPHALSALGLKTHLDRTKDKHNDHDHAYFLHCLEFGTPIIEISRRFNVEPPTIYKWLAQHKAEQKD